MKCVVFGGGGFIGSHLSEALIKAGHDVTIFDKPNARYLECFHQQNANIFTGDFFNETDLDRSLKGCDVAYHLVSVTVPQTSNENPAYDVKANILGTLQLLEAAKKASVQKIVFASSGGTVYGIPYELPIKENHLTDPITSYGITKLTIEKYLQLYWRLYGLDYCILRIANAYGERQSVTKTQGVIPTFLDNALQKKEIVVWGDGAVIRDYIYVRDIVRAFIDATLYKGEPRIFNIGSGQGHSLNQIISLLEAITQLPLQVRYTLGRPFDVPVNILDISRAQTLLNWYPSISLLDGITRMHDWMLNNNQR